MQKRNRKGDLLKCDAAHNEYRDASHGRHNLRDTDRVSVSNQPLIGSSVEYFTRRRTNMELAELTAGCFRISVFRNSV